MRRAVVGTFFAVALTLGTASAQHHASEAAKEAGESPSEGEHGSLELWKWANFALLAGVLGWAIKKNAGPWFASRSREIRKQMVEAEELQAEAERKTQSIEARLANLQADIDGMRQAALAEGEAETERLRRRTGAEIDKLQEQSRQEIEAAGKQARLELRRYSAELAIGLAEQRIRARMTGSAQEALVRSFIQNLDQPAPGAPTT
jgi:F-type H+-transporting ATPase subunit b